MAQNSAISFPFPTVGPSGPAAIEAAHLVKQYKKTLAVDDISFSIARGSITGLLGGNGAGKTTTIAMIMGLVLPLRVGSVYWVTRCPSKARKCWDG